MNAFIHIFNIKDLEKEVKKNSRMRFEVNGPFISSLHIAFLFFTHYIFNFLCYSEKLIVRVSAQSILFYFIKQYLIVADILIANGSVKYNSSTCKMIWKE